MKLPQARTAEIVEQELGAELLIYNLQSDKAYTLNETSKIIFQACDGQTTFGDLQRKHKFTEDLIYLTLDELKREDLINDAYQSKFARVSRREVIKKVGLASMTMLPVIASITAPSAVAAASCNCSPPASTCCSGVCRNLSIDNFNCGQCGNTCAGGTTCNSGGCCQSGLTYCSGTCTLLGTNTNCSSCGDVCVGGQSCDNGVCGF